MSGSIHPTSVVSPSATVAASAVIGPFCVIEDDVVIGERTTLMANVFVGNGGRIGNDVRIHPGAVIATAPQDLKYAGEPTFAFVGDRTVIREGATINRATVASRETHVGTDCLLMAYSHVAHDCRVGSHVILANSVQLGGHVEVGDWAIIGGLTGVHQFVRIGPHAMVAACIMTAKDVPPFTLVGRYPVGVENLNTVGLRRRGFSAETIRTIDEFYAILLRQGHNVSDGLRAYESAVSDIIPEVRLCIDFIRNSRRGIYR